MRAVVSCGLGLARPWFPLPTAPSVCGAAELSFLCCVVVIIYHHWFVPHSLWRRLGFV